MTHIEIDCREIRILEDTSPEQAGEYGVEFKVRIYNATNPGWSRKEILETFVVGNYKYIVERQHVK